MVEEFNVKNYLAKFTTKEQVKDELARLQKNMDNLGKGNFKYFQLLTRKKIPLWEKFCNDFCTKIYYIDSVGKTQWYYQEL